MTTQDTLARIAKDHGCRIELNADGRTITAYSWVGVNQVWSEEAFHCGTKAEFYRWMGY